MTIIIALVKIETSDGQSVCCSTPVKPVDIPELDSVDSFL